jgi:hypothetical protein
MNCGLASLTMINRFTAAISPRTGLDTECSVQMWQVRSTDTGKHCTHGSQSSRVRPRARTRPNHGDGLFDRQLAAAGLFAFGAAPVPDLATALVDCATHDVEHDCRGDQRQSTCDRTDSDPLHRHSRLRDTERALIW